MRFIFNPSTGNLESADNVTSPLKTLGEKFKVAELTNMNTPDLEQSPDSFLRPGETLEDWDVTFRRPNAHGGLQRQPFAPKNEIRLAGTTIPGKYETQAAMSKWLTNYTYADLLEDLKKGLTKMEIATNIYNNNKDLYDSMKITEGEYLKQYKNPEDAKIGKIANSIKNRLEKKPQLNTLHELNVKNLKRLENSVVKDVDKWIKKNASKYKGTQGAVTKFEKALYKFLEKKYSRLIKNAEGISESTKAGDKFISKFAKLSDYATSTDEGANYRAVKKKLYNALGIKWGKNPQGQPKTIYQTVNAALEELLPLAQKQGLIPKTYKNKLGGTSKINSPSQYFAWLQNTESNVMKKVFGNLLNFSVEHPGGLSRAKHLLDTESLTKIISMDMGDLGIDQSGKPMTANRVKGREYDSRITKLIEKAKFQATNVTQANKWLSKANKLSKEASKMFGTLQSTYTAVKDSKGNVEIKVKHPNISLNDSLVNKTKNTIHTFIANEGMKRPVFKKLPVKLKEAITLISNGKNADKIIASHLDEVIPNWKNTKSTTLRNFAGVVDFDMLPSGVSNAVAKATSALGKSLKVLGPLTLPLDVIPFAQSRDLGIKDWGKVGAKNLAQEYLNLPRTIEDLFHVAGEGTWKDFGSKKEEDRFFDYEPQTFGTKATVKALRETSNEEIIETIKNQVQEPDIAYGQQAFDPLLSGDNLEKRIKKALAQKAWADSLSPNDPLVKDEEVEVKETENVFGTQIPMKSITKGFSRDEFLAKGGRVGFADGTAHDDKSDEEILEWIKSQMFELEQGWNTGKSVPGKIMDVARVDNWPYYAARMLRAGMSVAEVSAKLPFVGIELLQKLATQPAFKVVPADTDYSAAQLGMGEKYMEGVDDSWLTDRPHNKLEGKGLFKEAFGKLMPGYFADKTGLNSLIEDMEAKMIAQGQSKWPVMAGSNVELGLDVTLPFGYVAAANKYKNLKKMLAPMVAGKSVDNVVEEALTDQGMSRRDFNKLLVSGGIVTALKTLGLDKLFKGFSRNPVPGSIKMLERSTSKMPVWFPKFIDKINDRMVWQGDGMWIFKGDKDFLPGFHIERVGDDYYISGKNQYEQDFQITYNAPRWEGDADGSYYNSGDFVVEDSVPVGARPEDVDFDGEVVDEVHNVLGGTKEMEEIAIGQKIKGTTKGENAVIEAEVKADQAFDQWRESDDYIPE